MLADRRVRGLDQTGLSQKAGPVVSDLVITADDAAEAAITSNHANNSGVDCLLAFDLLVGSERRQPARGATGPNGDRRIDRRRADRADGHRPGDGDARGRRAARPHRRSHPIGRQPVPGRRGLAAGLLGATTTANVLLLGAAVQSGAIPRPGRGARAGDRTQRRRRRHQPRRIHLGTGLADDPAAVRRAAGLPAEPPHETIYELIDRLHHDLVDYQSADYADCFREVVDHARSVERAVDPHSTHSPRPSPATCTS